MSDIRGERIGTEAIQSIQDIDSYISNNYLQIIKDKIELLKIKRAQIEDLRLLYESINTTNNSIINNIKNSSKYTQITTNQTTAEPLIDELNTILRSLLTIINSDITIGNLNYKEELYGIDKISITEGEFTSVEGPSNNSPKTAINKTIFNKELEKLERVPEPTQGFFYIATDNSGNIILKRAI